MPFQEIVNTYGVPNYQEINPGYFTIITFPFLFGVMFGDIGHGFVLFCIAVSFFSFKEQPTKPKPTDGLYKARYLFLLMSLFSIFSGFIYNEFFSIPISIFPNTCYDE
jgi:V-type H+-transporting ATPase subunit a